MTQTLPITIDEYHVLKTLDNVHERFAVDSKGEIYTYMDKVKDLHKKSDDTKLLNFHESIKSFTVYDDFGESRMVDLSKSLDVVITYPSKNSPRRTALFVRMRFRGRNPDNAKYFQFVLLNFLTDEK